MSLSRSLAILVLLLFALLPAAGTSQTSVPVVMLSDIHFDPFQDPGKVAALEAKPVEEWAAILDGAPSAARAPDLVLLQAACRGRALDTGWGLLKTSLAAAHDAEPHPLFVTLSGDLLAHEFTCRFHHLSPGANADALSAFSAKTVAFVLQQVSLRFPRVPVYGSLGNNDSGCTDYRETPGDAFLSSASAALAKASGAQGLALTPNGDYSLALPAPMRHTRLIVLQNTFEDRDYRTCAAAADRDPEKAQIDWLKTQLAQARAAHQQVWVMSHIPPGVDVYTSFRRYIFQPAEMCSSEPRSFLADTSLADTLLDYADIVRLALFGHTHMDEIRLLQRSTDTTADDKKAAGPSAIPAKLVPAVTPFLGNHPAFLVATVDPRTAVLKDWRTFISPNPEGSTPPWTEAYRYTAAYHLPDFSAGSVLKLARGFVADTTGQAPQSATFREHFYPGDIGLYSLGLGQIWPAYACTIAHDRPSAVHNCICAAVPKPKDNPTQP